MHGSLARLFDPGHVAVIGASDQEGKVGYAVMRNLEEAQFGGRVSPVNLHRSQVAGRPAVSHIKHLNEVPDLAVICVPAESVVDAVAGCGQVGVRNVIVLSAGFKETGAEGLEREQRLVELAQQHQINLVGPNCLGVIDTHTRLNASFAHHTPHKGHIAFFSQSGALGVALLDWAYERGIGFSRFISMGNKAVLNEAHFLEAAAEDEETQVIACYVEGIEDGHRFVAVAQQICSQKPIVLLKSGASAAGAQAASSHTGALAGADAAYDVALREAGVLRARTTQELFDLANAFLTARPPRGPRMAVVTNSGGPGIITTDSLEKQGMRLARLQPETSRRLRDALPPEASVYNPVDVLGDAGPERFQLALEAVMEDEKVQGCFVVLSPTTMSQPLKTAEVLAAVNRVNPDKPIFAIFMGGAAAALAREHLEEQGVSTHAFPETAVRAMAGLLQYRSLMEVVAHKSHDRLPWQGDVEAAAAVLAGVSEEGRKVLLGSEGARVLAAYNIPVAKTVLAENHQEAVAAAEAIGFPVALKIASPKILHKTDVGGVRLNLRDADEVRAAFNQVVDRVHTYLPRLDYRGVEVQAMVREGEKFRIEASRDVQFGPMISFGLGGDLRHLIDDRAFRLVRYLTRGEAERMVRETKAYMLLRGLRGREPGNFSSVVDAIGHVARLMHDVDAIAQCEVNPLMSRADGVTALDIKMTLA